MNHVWEFHGIADEENRQVVADQVVVPIFGVELYCKTPGIPHSVGRSSEWDYCRESDEHGSLLLWVLKEFCTSMFCHALVDLEISVGTCAFCMDDTLGNPFPVKVCKLLN